MMMLLCTQMGLQLYIYIVAMSISFLLSCILFFKEAVPFFFKTFAPFLFLIICVEFVATWLIGQNKSTILIFNISTTLEVTYYLWVLLNILQSKLLRKILKFNILAYPAFSLVDIYFIQVPGNFHSISYAFGCLLIIVFSLSYFLELFAYTKTVILSKEPTFWICTGLLFFYSVSFPLLVFVNVMTSFPAILANNLQFILLVLNVFLYLLFSIAFLCRITIKKS